MSPLGLILIVLLVIFLIGGFVPFGAAPGPRPLYSGYGYGWGGGIGIGTILVILLILLLLGVL